MDDNEKRSRALRLGTVRTQYQEGRITKNEAEELLRGPLSPGKPDSVRDDSSLLESAISTIMEFFGWTMKPPKS
jgi:hypothetical protein